MTEESEREGADRGSSSSSALDPKPLASLRQLGRKTGEDLFGQVVGIFQQEGPMGVDRMRRALAESDTGELAKTAHSLGGSAVHLGASALAKLCRELEDLAEQEALGGCESRLRSVEEELQRVLEELRSA